MAYSKNHRILLFSELNVKLLSLHGTLGGILKESYFIKYNKIKGNLSLLQEAEKEITRSLGEFWQQSKLYRNQLSDYINQGIYKKEKNKDKVLMLYTETREKAIKSIHNLIRFLTFENQTENEEQFFLRLQQSIQQLIADTNFYIENVWTIVQDILINQIQINDQLGINTQEKYKLTILSANDLTPDNSKLFEEVLKEAKQLCSGIFWVLSDDHDLNNYEFLMFVIPCDSNGNPNNTHSIELNSKSGNTYNHKKLWEEEIKNNSKYRPYNKKDYDYYPRGRVEISNNRATIFLNPHINDPRFIDLIKQNFGLFPYNIPDIRVITDGSEHYECFLDK